MRAAAPDSAARPVRHVAGRRITANRLEASTRIESSARRPRRAHEAWLRTSREAGWRLAQAAPVAGEGRLRPARRWTGSTRLLSGPPARQCPPRRQDRQHGAHRRHPANPTASGRLAGSDLRVAWVEQGVPWRTAGCWRTCRNDLFILDELQSSGPPRVRPEDRPAPPPPCPPAAKGTLSGKRPPAARRSERRHPGRRPATCRCCSGRNRWVVASGGGNIEMSARHVQVNGAFAADAGYVGFSRAEPADAVGRRGGGQGGARPPKGSRPPGDAPVRTSAIDLGRLLHDRQGPEHAASRARWRAAQRRSRRR